MKQAINPSGVFNPETHKTIDPNGLPWSQACKASGSFLYVSGQTATDAKGRILHEGDILRQTEVALNNLKKIIEELGLEMDSIVQLMWFVTDAAKFYESGASTLRRKYLPKRGYPTSTLVQIVRLADPAAMVEVQAVAVYEEKKKRKGR